MRRQREGEGRREERVRLARAKCMGRALFSCLANEDQATTATMVALK